MQTNSHPLNCCNTRIPVGRQDSIDGEIHDMMINRAKLSLSKADTSDSATDSENEMTIIRPKRSHKMRHTSDRSYGESLFLHFVIYPPLTAHYLYSIYISSGCIQYFEVKFERYFIKAYHQ